MGRERKSRSDRITLQRDPKFWILISLRLDSREGWSYRNKSARREGLEGEGGGGEGERMTMGLSL